MTGKKVILVVDDSSTARAFVCSNLKNAGFEVKEAGNGMEAIEVIERAVPDAMVLDLLMPEMDGFDLLEELQSKGISFPIVVLTADIQDGVKQEVLDLGATELLNKPQVRDHLVETVRRILV